MKKLLLALALSLSAAACGDMPTQSAEPKAPVAPRMNTSTAFDVDLILEQAADELSHTWYFFAALQNATGGHPSNYYFTWTDPIGNVLHEGWGQHVYTVYDGPSAHIDLEVHVTGPDGYAWDYIAITPSPIPSPYGGGKCDQGWTEFC